jgi:glycosyltransferase involved in cell wall biosynthesis
MKVLYVSHTSLVSGAEQTLLASLRSARDRFSPTVACPPGPLEAAVQELGVPVHHIPGTDLSARLHPLHTPREAAKVIWTALAIRSIADRVKPDVIHANTHRAGLVAALARGVGGVKPVVHVHDSLPPGRLPRLMFRLLTARSSAFLTTTRFLAKQFPTTHPPFVVANAVEPERFDPSVMDRSTMRHRLGLDETTPVIAVVGQISPHKAQSDAIRTLRLVREVHPDTRLLIIGSPKFASQATRFDNGGYHDELHGLAERLGVAKATIFLGERADIAEILAAVDVLLVPSWYEPFGLVALEGMVMGVPVVATTVGGITEVVTDGTDGLLVEPRQPPAWAAAVAGLLSDPARRTAMGARGRERALRDYAPERIRDEIVAVYERALRTRRRRDATLSRDAPRGQPADG